MMDALALNSPAIPKASQIRFDGLLQFRRFDELGGPC
jgi:hypothetical protein